MSEIQGPESPENSLPSLLNEADVQIFQKARPKFGRDGKYLEFLKVLACTLECKDQYTHGHSGRVTYYCMLIAERIKMSDEEKDQLQLASFLHDIGKLGVSNNLVDKEDRLDEREWTLIKEHPERGVSLIEPLNIPGEILDIIRHHHERYDGLGYPYGLAGQEIPLGARIVTMADAYDAMSSDRPYRKALSTEAIREEILRCSGAHFDPDLVKVFLQVLDEEDLAKYCATGALPNGDDIWGGYMQ
jgi:putative nucleotidyltransferase with HDIG domain